MPLFIIETTAESPIREFWQIEAATAREARDKFDNGEVGAFLWDEVTGDETGREVSLVHGPGDLASTVAIHRAQQAAPAMLAALRKAADALNPARNAEEAEALRSIQSAIAAATGTPTDETGAAAPTDGPAREFTAFCQQADGRGTIWIDKVRGDTIESATAAAREACAADWGCKADKVHCLGLIEGAATVAHWQDVCDVPAATGER